MAQINFTPLEDPILDPRSEEDLVNRALDLTFVASGGTLNDRSLGSPLRAVIEGGCFAQAEFLYYLNRLPEAIAIQFLKIMGIQRKLGSTAQVGLVFTLTSALSNPFAIPQGFLVSTSDGACLFTTNTQLIIPAGQVEGVVFATATTTGTICNVAAYSITQLSQPLAYLQGVVNVQPASGGTEEESIEQVKTRAFQAIRQRGLISADDYEQRVISILGDGAAAKAIGNLAADAIAFEKGSVHIFALNPDGSLLNTAQITTLQSDLQSKTLIGANAYVSSADIVPVQIYLIASLLPGSSAATTADSIYEALNDYLLPGKLPFGQAIVHKEVEYVARLAGAAGIDYIQQLAMGISAETRLTTNLELAHAHSVAKLVSLVVELVPVSTSTSASVSGQNFLYFYGLGDPD